MADESDVRRQLTFEAARALAEEGRHLEACEGFRLAADSGCTEALFHLGFSLCQLGRWDEGAAAYAQAAESGDDDAWLNLAIAYHELERWGDAEAAARRAIESGEPMAWAPLGVALLEQGDVSGGIHALRRATEHGDPQGMLQLAFVLREQGNETEAILLAQSAARTGDVQAVAVVACWSWYSSLDVGLEDDLRNGVVHYAPARAALADLLVGTGRVSAALQLLKEGVAQADKSSWLPLGNMYRDIFGDDASAEAAYRGGAEAGDSNCFHNLGLLLLEHGRVDAALEMFERGAAAGDALAAGKLREMR